MPEVIIIGSGTGVPSLNRASPAVLIKTRNNFVLLDSGPGTLRQLLKVNVAFSQIDLILYTHFHPDHITDLIHFLFASKYTPGFQRKTPVFIWGPPGFLEFYERLKGAFGKWIEAPRDKITLAEIPPDALWAYEDIYIQPFSTFHTQNSQGYCLQVEGKKIAYPGDTDYDTSLIEAVKEVDLLICEASFPGSQKVEGHLTPALAGELASQARVKCLLLLHLYPECDTIDVIAECRQCFQGPLYLGQDLMHIKV